MTTLARRLGLGDAVIIGLGSMIGAGVFAVWAPAAAAAGSWLLVSVGLAALVAFCNAWSSARLAARYPSSGGTYLYGREVLGEWWGFLAGWGFVIGKTASCAAMALTFASYVLPGSAWARPLAALVVLALALLNTRGVTKTAALARALVIPVLVILIGAIGLMGLAAPLASPALVAADAYGVLQAAGLLFFAFAGYARIATMGEEVRDPSRTIPRAIIGALTLTVALYAGLGWVLLARLGPDGLATSPDPVAAGVAATGVLWAEPLVRLAAALASAGALLGLVAGVGRTTLAMARNGDLPRRLAAVHPQYQVPHVAELTLGVVVAGLVLAVDLRGAIGFSSFGVLLYYVVANLAAVRLDPTARSWTLAVPVLGMLGCVTLVATLPPMSVVAGLAVYVVGILVRLTTHRHALAAPPSP